LPNRDDSQEKRRYQSHDGIIVMSPDELRKEQRKAAAAKLFEMGKLSSGAAARLAGVPRTVFLAGLANSAMDTFRLTEVEEVTPKAKKNIAERTYGLIKLDAKSIDEIIEDTKYGSQSECDYLIKEEEKANRVLFERAVEDLNLTDDDLQALEKVRETVWKEEKKNLGL